MARPEGLEPATPRFVVWYSIQLSYGRTIMELPGGFEPSVRELQSLALPLGYGSAREIIALPMLSRK